MLPEPVSVPLPLALALETTAVGNVLGTAENFVPRYAVVFRLRTAVLYRGVPRLDQNI